MALNVLKTENTKTVPEQQVVAVDDTDTEFKQAMDVFINKLHQALDFHQLITRFTGEVRRVMPCDGIAYEEESIDLYFMDGALSRQSCHYNLSYQGQSLGTIKFTRSNLFSEDELAMLETMLAGLTLPLRNALQYQRAIKVAQRDELTGLRNGAYYHDSVDLEIERSRRYKTPFSLIMLDLDNFCRVNEYYGREAGDRILKQVAIIIEEQARSSDIVFRHAGDEFLVFLPNTKKADAVMVAERIKCEMINKPPGIDAAQFEVTLSAGVVTVMPDDTTYRLIDRVDKALFHAKILGKNRVHAEASPENISREWA